MKKQENHQERICQEKNIKKKMTLTDWLVKTVGASAVAGLCALHGGSDGREVYENLCAEVRKPL